MSDTDWKKELDELGNLLRVEYGRHKVAVEEIKDKAKVVIKKGGKDAQKHWDEIDAQFRRFGKLINWVKYRAVYIAGFAIILGLIAHYVFGV